MAIHPPFSRPRYQSRLKSGAFSIVTRQECSFAALLMCWLVAGTHPANAMPSPLETDRAAAASDTAPGLTRLAQTKPAQAQTPSAAPAPSAASPPATTPSTASAADEPIGNVATLTGSATVTRNNASTPLQLQDDIFQGDVLQTSANSTLGVTFDDATTFNLTANATITVDSFVYEEGGKQNGALFDVARGTVAFVAAAVAHTGDMKISTPSATLGIRGTTGLIEVPQGASGDQPEQCRDQTLSRRRRPGRTDRGQRPRRLAAWLPHPGLERLYDPARRHGTLRRGAAGDLAAAGVARSGHRAAGPCRAERRPPDRHADAASSVSRIRTEIRRAAIRPPTRRVRPACRRQNGLPQRPGQPQQPGSPQRLGTPQQPGVSQPTRFATASPALPNRAGQPQLQPPPGVQRPGLQNRPALLPRRPVLPGAKGKAAQGKALRSSKACRARVFASVTESGALAPRTKV